MYRPFTASDELKDAARKWVDKLSVKNGTYPPDSYPNPGRSPLAPTCVLDSVPTLICCTIALAYHNAQLEASAFRDEFDPDSFEDLTLPKYGMIQKVRRALICLCWRIALMEFPILLPVTLTPTPLTRVCGSHPAIASRAVAERMETSITQGRSGVRCGSPIR